MCLECCLKLSIAMNMINFSIIIPHKNSAALLQYCLDSIPLRDDIQVIVVDDNSDAGKVDFDNFPRWKGNSYECYFTKEGKGAGYARNVGMEHAVGKWFVFLDADDFLTEDADRIFEENKDADADIVFFRHKAVKQDDHNVVSIRDNYKNELIDEYFESHEDWKLRIWSFIPVCKFVRRSMVEHYHIHFDEVKYSNDCYFSACTGVKANNILVRNDVFYVITESSNSLTSFFCTKPGELECRAEVFFRVVSLANENGYPIDEIQMYRYLCRLFSAERKLFVYYCRQLIKMGKRKSEIVKECFKTNKFSSRVKRSVYAYIVI